MAQVHALDTTTNARVSDKVRHESDGIAEGINIASNIAYTYDDAGRPNGIVASVSIVRKGKDGKPEAAHITRFAAVRSENMVPYDTCTAENMAGKGSNAVCKKTSKTKDYSWEMVSDVDIPVFAGGVSYGTKTYKGAVADIAAGKMFTDGGTQTIVSVADFRVKRTTSIMGHISGLIRQYVENVTGMYEPARTASVPSVSRRAALDALAETIRKCIAAKNHEKYAAQSPEIRAKIEKTLADALAEQSRIMGLADETEEDPFADFA